MLKQIKYLYKTIFLFITVIFSSYQLLAQFEVGVKAGLNTAGIWVGPNASQAYRDRYEAKVAYHGGVFGQLSLPNGFSVNPELLFSEKGSKVQLDNNEEGNTRLYYLSLPVLAGYQPLNRFTLLMGPEVGYLLAAKDKSPYGTVDASNVYNQDLEISLTTGLNYEIIKKGLLTFRYVHGLSTVRETDITTGATWKNRVFQLAVGYKL
jgi:hypothetical protein